MPASAVPLRLMVGGLDLTEKHDGLTFSNADPGGLEALTCIPATPEAILPGDTVRVDVGCETAWVGEVNDPGDKLEGSRGSGVLAALGPGMALKAQSPPLAYVHNRLADYTDMASAPNATLGATGLVGASAPRREDNGAIVLGFPKGYSVNNPALVGVVLDLGPGSTAKRVVVNWSAWGADGAYQLWVRGSDYPDNNASYGWAGGNFTDAISAVGAVAGPTVTAGTFSTARRYVQVFFYSTFAQTLALDIWIRINSIQVFADTAYESGNASIFNPTMMALDAFRRAGGIVLGEIGDASSFPISHAAYQSATRYETLLEDAARMMGWHYGVWEPAGIFSDQPRGFFRQQPADATCAVQWADCTGGEAPRARLDLLYDTCRCQYADNAGTTGFVTVTKPNPLLASSRTLDVNMGTGSAATAAIYAGFALALSQRAARGGGWAALPQFVQTPSGPRPSCLLKSGRDRIRIIGLPDAGNLLETDTRRYDSFHLRRVEVTIDEHGVPRTRVEFDGGGDLMEVLNARLGEASSRAAQLVAAA